MYTKLIGAARIVAICVAGVVTACGPSPAPPAPTTSASSSSTATDGPPTLGTITPPSGSGKTQTFTATYSHPDGAKKVVSAFLLVERTVTGTNACFLEYNSSTNKVNLMNDAGKWQTGITAGSPGTLSNTQCTVDAAGVRGTTDGNTLTVTFPLTFAPAYAGMKRVFLNASTAKANTSWVEKGRWEVP